MALRKRRVLYFAPLFVVGLFGVAWTCGWLVWWPQEFARQALARRDYDAALEWANQAARLDELNAETEFLLARVERKLGHLQETQRHLGRAVKLGLEDDRRRREEILAQAQSGALNEILSQLDKMLVDQRGDGAEVCEAYVNGLLANGQLNEAEALIHQWSQAFSTDPMTDCLRGRMAESRHAYVDAVRHYRDALLKNSRHFPSAYGLGRSLIELHRWQEAYDSFQACLAMRVQAPAQLGMARCLVSQGQDSQARELLLRAAAIPQAIVFEAYKRVGESTEFDHISFELGALEAKLSHFPDAVKWLEQAIAHNSKHRQAHYQLALVLNAMGRTAEAKPHLDYFTSVQKKLEELDRLHGIVQLHPEDLDARCRFGKLHLDVDSDAVGLFWLRSVLSRDPNHRPTHAALADYYAKKAAVDPNLESLSQHHREQSQPPPNTTPGTNATQR